MSDQNSPEFYIDNFEHDDLVFFSSRSGIAINTALGRVILFQSTLGRWVEEEYALSDIRSAVERAPVADQYYAVGNGRTTPSVGQNIGAAAQNASAQASANSQTGIVITLKSTALPEFLIHVVQTKARKSLMEALRQVLKDGKMSEPFCVIPSDVREFYYRPTTAELAAQDALEQRQQDRKKATRMRFWDYLVSLVLALMIVVPAWGYYKQNVPLEARLVSVSTLEDFILYFGCVTVIGILALKAWKNIRFLMLPR